MQPVGRRGAWEWPGRGGAADASPGQLAGVSIDPRAGVRGALRAEVDRGMHRGRARCWLTEGTVVGPIWWWVALAVVVGALLVAVALLRTRRRADAVPPSDVEIAAAAAGGAAGAVGAAAVAAVRAEHDDPDADDRDRSADAPAAGVAVGSADPRGGSDGAAGPPPPDGSVPGATHDAGDEGAAGRNAVEPRAGAPDRGGRETAGPDLVERSAGAPGAEGQRTGGQDPVGPSAGGSGAVGQGPAGPDAAERDLEEPGAGPAAPGNGTDRPDPEEAPRPASLLDIGSRPIQPDGGARSTGEPGAAAGTRANQVPEPADSALAALDTGLVGPSPSFGGAAAAVSAATARPGPYPGSLLPAADGSAPSDEHQVKGNEGSRRFHTPDSPYYLRTRGDVWFRTPDEARAAGFTAWDAGR